MAGTIYDVAKLAGVSSATVSRVINETGKVSEKTIAKVNKAIETLQYTPNALAQSFILNKSNMIGLVVQNHIIEETYNYMDTIFSTELQAGVVREAEKRGYNVVLINKTSSYGQLYHNFVEQKRCDALICSSMPSLEEIRDVVEKKGAFVYLGHFDEYQYGLRVYAGLYQYIIDGLNYLIENGHKKIFLISQISDDFLKNNMENYSELEFYHYNLDDLFKSKETEVMSAIVDIFSKEDRPTAIFMPGSHYIQRLIEELGKIGLRVPDDVSLLANVHAKGVAETFTPKISAIYIPAYIVGKQLAKLTFDYIDKKLDSYCEERIVDYEFVINDSIKCIK